MPGGATVTHFYNGELNDVFGGSGIGAGYFEYNYLQKLTGNKPNHSSSNVINYRYNANGLRAYYSDNTGKKRYFIFAGDTLIGEVTGSTPSVVYTHGATGLISQRILTGTPSSYWYHFGPQGETRQLTNSLGAVTDTYLFSAFGSPISASGTTSNSYRYGGKFGYYSEGWGGIILAGQRWYSAPLMRWLTRDPAGYPAGPNLYEYAFNRPTFYVDPTGLDAAPKYYPETETPARPRLKLVPPSTIPRAPAPPTWLTPPLRGGLLRTFVRGSVVLGPIVAVDQFCEWYPATCIKDGRKTREALWENVTKPIFGDPCEGEGDFNWDLYNEYNRRRTELNEKEATVYRRLEEQLCWKKYYRTDREKYDKCMKEAQYFFGLSKK